MIVRERCGWNQFEVEGLEWKLNWTSRMTMSAWEETYILFKSHKPVCLRGLLRGHRLQNSIT